MSEFGLSILSAAAILAGAWIVGGWAGGLLGAVLGQTRIDPMVRALLVRLIRPLVVGIGVVAAVSQLGVDIRVLLAVVAAGALALGLALKGPVANVIAGMVLFSRRPFRVGDEVQIAGVSGEVKGTGWFAVVMDEADGTRTVIPNHLILDEPIRITKRGE